MRDRLLHDALHTLTEDAADLLEGRLAAGEEIPFEVGETGATQTSRRSTALYAYRPLTAEFVASHAEPLRSLESFESAVANLARTHGAVAYLRGRGEPVLEVSAVTHARLAVLAFLAAVWSEAETFENFEDRFDHAYTELESVVLEARLVTTAFIPVYGVILEADEVNLGDGVQLVATDTLTEECEARFADDPRVADCYCAVSIDAPSDAPLPVAELRHESRCALTALRLFKPGSVSFGLGAQTEVAGTWRSVAMPFSGRARDEAWRLLDGEDDELRQFMAAVRRVEKRTRTSWALKRFEMGLERTVPAEGLTDFLAAGRALLEADDDKGRAALPARIAALCARDDERRRVATAVECAFSLERLAINGSVGKADRKRLAALPPLATISEMERCLRALLHDLICGYLDSDLRKLADEILLADGAPVSVEEAIDREAGFDAGFFKPAEDLGVAASNAGGGTQEFDPVFDDTAEIEAADLRLVDDLADGVVDAAANDAAVNDAADSAAEGAMGDGDAELADAPTTAFDTEQATGQDEIVDGPADEWTAAVIEDEQRWWSPEKSRAQYEAALEPADADDDNGAIAETGPFAESPQPAQDDAEAFEQTTQSYPELDASARMHQLAEELVDGFDRALTGTMSDADGDVDGGGDGDGAVERKSAGAERDPAETERMSFTRSGDGDLTFNFPVLARAQDDSSPPLPPPVPESSQDEPGVGFAAQARADGQRVSQRDGQHDGRHNGAALSAAERTDFIESQRGLTGDFPVPEFEMPDRVRHERLRELLGDRPGERHNFDQIMNKAYPGDDLGQTPASSEPHSGEEGESVVPADFKRPRLVALNGGAGHAPVPLDHPPVPNDVTTPAPSGPATPAVDARQTHETESLDLAPPADESDHDGVDHSEARSSAIGPATIEFRLLVDPELDDPDDFAGAC